MVSLFSASYANEILATEINLGNKEIKKFTENYGYDLEPTLERKGIKEMADPKTKEDLFSLLKKRKLPANHSRKGWQGIEIFHISKSSI